MKRETVDGIQVLLKGGTVGEDGGFQESESYFYVMLTSDGGVRRSAGADLYVGAGQSVPFQLLVEQLPQIFLDRSGSFRDPDYRGQVMCGEVLLQATDGSNAGLQVIWPAQAPAPGEIMEAVQLADQLTEPWWVDFQVVTQPDQPGPLVARADFRLRAGDGKGALEDLSRALELQPESAEIYFHRGMCHLRTGQLEPGIHDLTRSIELNPGEAAPFQQRGRALASQGEHEKAVADFDKVVELAKDYAMGYFERAKSLTALGRRQDAQSDLDRARQLDPRLGSRP